jgi:general secretion pathway protein D
VTGNVQYIDVGLKLDVEPHIYAENEVGIKINLEVSNITGTLKNDQSGTTAPQIGTRNATTSLRLKDGETQVLAGLIRDEERNSASKVPGLGQAPVVGRLFSSNTGDSAKTEIVLTITPRIIRAQGHADARTRDVWSGTDGQVRENPLRLDPIGAVGTSPTAAQPALQPPAPGVVPPTGVPAASPENGEAPATGAAAEPGVTAAPPAVNPAAARAARTGPAGRRNAGQSPRQAPDATPAEPATPTPSAAPATPAAAAEPQGRVESAGPLLADAAGATGNVADVAATTMVAASAGSAKAASAAAGGAAAAARPAVLSANSAEFTLEGPKEVIAGQPFEITLKARTAGPVRLIPLQIRFDSQAFSVDNVRPGALAVDAGIESVQPAIDTRTGRVDVTLTTAGASRIQGDGTLLTLTLTGRSPRITTRVAVAAIRLTGDEALTVAQPAQLVMRVKGS